jgi:hypothetical protein
MSFHTSCIHRYDQGWSCSALTDHTSVFYFSPEDPFGNVTCGFCGAKFCAITAVNSQDSDILVEHAKSVHRFAECNMAEKFAEKLLFHEHLINAHDATLGPWTEMLEDACYYQIFSSLPSMKATADLGRTLETQEAVSTTEIKHTILQPFAIDLEPRVDLLLSKTESPFSLGGQLGTTDAAAILDFNAFESLIAQAGGSTSENLMEYLRYNQMTETIRVHVRMISALTAHLGIAETSFEKLKSQQAYWEILGSLKSIESEKDRYRQACWSEGYDVDEIDRMLKTSERYETVSNTSSDIYQEPESEQHMSWWDVLHHTGPQNWLTKKDRINSWLLQNLAAQPKEALCHRKYLQDQGADDQLSEEEWARLVLKFWTLDDAARPSEDADCSTNGAVDSDGACHSARVKLVESLPVREKWDLVDIVSKSETSTVDL